ncbi:pseudomurein-binding repeat-containing protein [Methanobrevibacter filiformis]|uniref:pseudomurein-binding repeat-containing protein n=1 Tax=Methanobrevibacter filiformis TaxID=55758 RepID=UPI001B803E48|nr:transglutaminase domain-containing protein [Methanobrevibacter filiformis]
MNLGMIYADDINQTNESLFTENMDNLSLNAKEYSMNSLNSSNGSTNDYKSIETPTQELNSNISKINDSKLNTSGNINNTTDIISSSSNSSESNKEKVNENLNNSVSTKNKVQFAGSSLYTVNKSAILDAAAGVKKFVEKNNRVPDYVIISGDKFSMSDFLYMLSKTIVNIANKSSDSVKLSEYKNPSAPQGTAVKGKVQESQYIDLSKRVVAFYEKHGIAPNFGKTNLGNIQFQSMIDGFSRILNFVKVNKVLPKYVSYNVKSSSNINKVIPKITGTHGLTISHKPGNSSSSSNNTNNTIYGNMSIGDIKKASTELKNYIDSYNKVPSAILVDGKKYSMSEFLYLMAASIEYVYSGINKDIQSKPVGDSSSTVGNAVNGTLYAKDYIDLASRIVEYIDAYGKAPDYGISPVGKLQYQNIVDGFSRVLHYVNVKQEIPDYVSYTGKVLKSVDVVVGNTTAKAPVTVPSSPMNSKYDGESLAQYLQATTNAQVNDPVIQALAKKITAGCTSELSKAVALFNWVRDNVGYSYYFNTQQGAKKVTTSLSANCVDTSHLLIALSRASGLPARYVNGKATFNSGNVIGHTWAQILIGDVWVVADAISSRNSFGVINNWNTKNPTIYGKYASISF